MDTPDSYAVIGLMSGSSLDGLDLVCCRFFFDNGVWSYTVEASECMAYPEEIAASLRAAFYKNSTEINKLNLVYGKYLGEQTHRFMQKFHLHPDFIASHGHTIFHRPSEGYTLQIGDGQAIASETGLMVINDFRSLDVLRGGQGAPLVPMGDRLLFANYGICLNLGGIANLSFDYKGERIAFDVCIANQALNFSTNQLGKAYDENGEFSRQGKVDMPLLQHLNALPYYAKPFPKSLGREFFENEIKPLFSQFHLGWKDILRTMVEHISLQIAVCVDQLPPCEMLVTGGGAFNSFLIAQIEAKSKHLIVVPDKQTIAFKEAIVFAFLGVLRYRNEINCLKSVTGAFTDSCTGIIHHPVMRKVP